MLEGINRLKSPMLKMLPALELSRSKAAPVASLDEIRADAEEMLKMIDGSFRGVHEFGYALAHPQVAAQPKSFFVVHTDLVEKPKDAKGWKRVFRHRIIINPLIIQRPDTITKKVKDIPELVRAGAPRAELNHKVTEIKNHGNLLEGCLSFQHRKAKYVHRYHRILVSYQTPDGWFGGLRKHTEWIEGLAAHIFQHENDHFNGANIFF